MVKLPTWWNKKALPAAEWVGENAFLPPGMHRLLTAFGLTSGLWIGRELADFIVARRSSDGTEIPRSQVPELFRPIHGVMRYNRYSDAPGERWKAVADSMLPVAFGVLGAYGGSKVFAHGKPPAMLFGSKARAFHPASEALLKAERGAREAHAAGKPAALWLDQLDGLSSIKQADMLRKLGAAGFAFSSVSGLQIFGGLFLIGPSAIANTFQVAAGRKVQIFKPGIAWIDRHVDHFNAWMGNRSSGSRYLPAALNDLVTWAKGNIAKGHPMSMWADEAELHKRARDMLQIFRHVAPGDEAKLAKLIGQKLKALPPYNPNHQTEFRKLLNDTFRFEGYEKMLVEAQLSPSTWKSLELGDNGPFTQVARMLGSGRQESELRQLFYTRFKTQHPQLSLPPIPAETHPGYVLTSIAGGAALTGSAAYLGVHHHQQQRAALQVNDEAQQNSRLTQAIADRKDKKYQTGNLIDWLNDKPLSAAEWLSRIMIQPPSMHRFMSALFLSGALFGGMRFANILAGRELKLVKTAISKESFIPREKVLAPLRPLHGLLSYTPGSSAVVDRWRNALHMIIPAFAGVFGTYTGSRMFFNDRVKKMNAPESQYLEDYADKASYEQSKFYAGATALTSIFNTGSGVHLLPVFNYSANLQNRYMMGAGYQIALPGIGKWWSGNDTLLPWGVKRTLKYLTNYLAYNPAEHPLQLPELVHGVTSKLFPHLTREELGQKDRALIEAIYAKRDPFLVDGKIPEANQKPLAEAMKAMLTGAGLEKTLLAIGLNPAEADIAHNGASGKIAEFFGRGSNVAKLKQEYQQSFAKRLHAPEKPIAKPKPLPASFQERLLPAEPTQAMTHL
jgi:hypothetical protein